MLHARSDYRGIQPWPTKRPHLALRREVRDGRTVEFLADYSVSQLPEDEAIPRIPDDEPVMLFRSSDKLAPEVLEAYIELLMTYHADKELVDAVIKQQQRMIQYAKEHYDGGKLPDADKGWL